MLVVDAHMHVLDTAWIPDGIRWAWSRQAAGRKLPEREPADIYQRMLTRPSDGTGELTIAAMKRAGVAASIIPVVDWTIVGQPCGEHLPIRALNAANAALGECWPGQIFHCAGVDPRHSVAREILDVGLSANSCVGLKLYPAAGWDVEDPDHAWVWRQAAELELPVVVHTAPIGGDPIVTPNSRPSRLAPVLARHPSMTLVFAHAGFEAWWLEALDIAHGWQRTYLELSMWPQLAVRDYDQFRRCIATMVDRLGAHRILFGTDLIRGTDDHDGAVLERCVSHFLALGEPYAGAPPVLSGEELELIMGANAARIYQLDLSIS